MTLQNVVSIFAIAVTIFLVGRAITLLTGVAS